MARGEVIGHKSANTVPAAYSIATLFIAHPEGPSFRRCRLVASGAGVRTGQFSHHKFVISTSTCARCLVKIHLLPRRSSAR
jgi:hypothetical protein